MHNLLLTITDASITDWIQVIFGIFTLVVSTVLSIVTLLYLKKNFSEQLKVNQAQLNLLEIEKRRTSREIRPSISLEFVRTEGTDFFDANSPVYNPSLLTRTYRLIISKNFASDICFEYFDLPTHGCYSNEFKPGVKLQYSGLDLNIILYVQFAREDQYNLNYPIQLRIHCRDEDGSSVYKDFSLLADNVLSESYNKDSIHPNVNTCNFFNKSTYRYSLGHLAPTRYAWMPAFSPGATKKETLRMFPMWNNYSQPTNFILQSTDSLAWPLEPFK